MSKAGDDPLSGLGDDDDGDINASKEKGGASSGGNGGAWKRYYDGLELIEEIKRDLTRLYPR